VTETPNPHILDADTMTGDMRPIRQAVLALGSNKGDRFQTLQGAVNALADTPEVKVVSVSRVYESPAVDAPEGSRDFLNAVLLIDTTLSVHTLLDRAHAVESAFGRVRTGAANEPRTLDVDLIVVGERIAQDADLVLPHPRAHTRAFVLRPWLDIDPEAYVPGQGLAVDLIGKIDQSTLTVRDDLELVL
jgi:2-amino-4-hydroxy-6-hydroxymethyldihydropteridine diphosphokinase